MTNFSEILTVTLHFRYKLHFFSFRIWIHNPGGITVHTLDIEDGVGGLVEVEHVLHGTVVGLLIHPVVQQDLAGEGGVGGLGDRELAARAQTEVGTRVHTREQDLGIYPVP